MLLPAHCSQPVGSCLIGYPLGALWLWVAPDEVPIFLEERGRGSWGHPLEAAQLGEPQLGRRTLTTAGIVPLLPVPAPLHRSVCLVQTAHGFETNLSFLSQQCQVRLSPTGSWCLGTHQGGTQGFAYSCPLSTLQTTPSANCLPICNKDNSLDTVSSALSARGHGLENLHVLGASSSSSPGGAGTSGQGALEGGGGLSASPLC